MIKLDIVSGFLGAGKTTFCNLLLKHYLRAAEDGRPCKRPVFIVNEFGKTSLDAEIIKADGFDAIELEGGCICCTLKDDIATSIIQVVEEFAPTNIVFEPSGIFIFNNFYDILKQPEIAAKCEFGNAVTIVDSVNFSPSKAAYGSFVYNQIKNAAVLVLSKLEKTKADVNEIICDLKNINPEAFIVSKVWSELTAVDFDEMLNERNGVIYDRRDKQHAKLASTTIQAEKQFTQEKLDELVEKYVGGVFGELYRVKGVINVNGKSALLNFALYDAKIEPFNGAAENRLTFIGQTVDKAAVSGFIESL